MKKYLRILWIAVLWLLPVATGNNAYGKTVSGKAFRYKIDLPSTMRKVEDTVTQGENEQLYFDTSNDVVLIISGRATNLRSVDDYINCANPELEQNLQNAFGDSSVQLISCSRSKYYPGKSAVVHFCLTDEKDGLNTYVVYFIHNKDKDLQISFTYQKKSEQQCIAFIDSIMQTFKLK